MIVNKPLRNIPIELDSKPKGRLPLILLETVYQVINIQNINEMFYISFFIKSLKSGVYFAFKAHVKLD